MKLLSKITNKLILTLLIAGASCYAVVKLNHIDNRLHEITNSNKRFCPSQIICHFPNDPEWEVQTPPELITYINVITQQPFHWLAKGCQAYAFASQDGEYVIKFFQQHRLRELSDLAYQERPFSYIFSKSYREKIAAKLTHKKEIFSSSKLAFEEIPEESGILFAHLNRTKDILRGIRISDTSGQVYKVKSDQVSFIVQKRATYILPTISGLMKDGDVDHAKVRLDQIFDLLVSLAKKKIVDGDHALVRNNNMGFVKDRAIYIDTGHIWKDPNLNVEERVKYEFRVRLRPLYDWLNINHKELGVYYKEKTEEIIKSLQIENLASIDQTPLITSQ